MFDKVVIISRDINGNRSGRLYHWDEVNLRINSDNLATSEDEILLIMVNGSGSTNYTCIYSALTSPPITWQDVSGFFA